MKWKYTVIACILFQVQYGVGQISSDCDTAIPICSNTPVNSGTSGYGLDDFGGSASGCLRLSQTGVVESNSAWYRFRTGEAGQLGFNIGFDSSEDWDFALYKTSDCNSLGDPVRCNFYDNSIEANYMGAGEDPTGRDDTFLYEPWLQVEPGEDYYLLINNFSNTNSGFSIQFTGQIFADFPYTALDCSIISNLLGPPVAACQGDVVPLDASLPNALSYQWFWDDGSGFSPITGATGPVYNANVDGFYRVQVQTSDPSQIISDVQVGFSPLPVSSAVSDEELCLSGIDFDLSLKDMEVLGMASSNAFRVSYHNSLNDAVNDINSLPVLLSLGPGTRDIFIRLTNIQNPDCFDASEQFQITAVEAPLLDFPEEVLICGDGSQVFIGPPIPETGVVYSWDDGQTTAQIQVSVEGTYTLSASRSQGSLTCTTTRNVTVRISEPPGIAGILIEAYSDANTVTVEPINHGNFEYALDNGAFQASPIFNNILPGNHTLRMRDILGCSEISEPIVVVGYLPYFTPNGDGVNDLWAVSGLETLNEPVVHIFDRYGKLLKELNLNQPGWDGRFNGNRMPASDYWFKLYFREDDGTLVQARYVSSHFSLKR